MAQTRMNFAWSEIDQSFVQTLYNTQPKIMQEIIKVRGENTKYWYEWLINLIITCKYHDNLKLQEKSTYQLLIYCTKILKFRYFRCLKIRAPPKNPALANLKQLQMFSWESETRGLVFWQPSKAQLPTPSSFLERSNQRVNFFSDTHGTVPRLMYLE